MRRGLILVLLVTLAALLPVPVGAATPFGSVTELSAESGDSPGRFGWSVAISGDGTTAVVGDESAGSPGLAVVFERSITGTWARSTAIDPPANSLKFGYSVGVSDDGGTIVVGDFSGGGENTGFVAVVERPSAGWNSAPQTTPDAVLEPASSAGPDVVGWSVAISGDGTTVVAGDPGAGSSGAVYVFEKPSNGGWTSTSAPTGILRAPASEDPGQFGQSVVISDDGETVVIGDWDGGSDSDGLAFVYLKSTSGWTSAHPNIGLTPQAVLEAPSNTDTKNFGQSVAISGDATTVVVGDQSAGSSSLGAAFVFEKPSSGGWIDTSTPDATLSGPVLEDPRSFGVSVSISDDGATIAVGDRDGGETGDGRVFVFDEPDSGWSDGPGAVVVLAGDPNSSEDFGYSVSVSDDGTRLVAGDPTFASTAGNAVIFEPLTPDALASVDIQGALAVQATDVEFPSANIGLTDVTVSFDALSNPWQLRGDNSAWSLTLEVAGDLISGSGATIPVNALDGGLMTVQIENEDIVPGTNAGLNPISAVPSPAALSVGSALTVLDADGSGSTGLFDLSPAFTLAIPGATPDGSYATSIIATMVSGP